jgi:hypothetical protein
MKRWILLVLVLAGGLAPGRAAEEKGKYAIVLQAGAETNEGTARAVHALLYARELAENGYGVVLIFDGAGTGWANELRKPECALYPHYMKIKELGMVEEICDYCAESFNLKDDLPKQQRKLLVGEYAGHPSLVKWIGKGYQIIVL